MSASGSMMAEDKESIRKVMYIMIIWTIAVIVVGILLVLIRDPFASIFAFSGLY